MEGTGSPSQGARGGSPLKPAVTLTKISDTSEELKHEQTRSWIFCKGIKESFQIGANGSTGKLIMWKLPGKKMCSSNESFISTTGAWHQQTGKPKCGHAACVGQGEVLTGRTPVQQVLLEMQKTGKLSPAKTLLTERSCSRSLKSRSGRESQGCSPWRGAVWMHNLPSLSTRELLTCHQPIYRNFLCLLNAGVQVHWGQPRPS